MTTNFAAQMRVKGVVVGLVSKKVNENERMKERTNERTDDRVSAKSLLQLTHSLQSLTSAMKF